MWVIQLMRPSVYGEAGCDELVFLTSQPLMKSAGHDSRDGWRVAEQCFYSLTVSGILRTVET